MRQLIGAIAWAILLGTVFGCSEPLTAREKTAGVGIVTGSTLGAAIGSTFGYAGTGGIVGAGLGLGVGVVVGGQVEALEKKRHDLDQKIKQCELELQRLCDELEKLKNELQER